MFSRLYSIFNRQNSSFFPSKPPCGLGKDYSFLSYALAPPLSLAFTEFILSMPFKHSMWLEKHCLWTSLTRIFRYYYKRTSSDSTTTAPSPTAAIPSTSRSAFAPPAPVSPSSSCSPGPPEEQAESPEGSRSSQQGGASGLPDFMRGVRVLFYHVGATERKKLARYLIAYPLN